MKAPEQPVALESRLNSSHEIYPQPAPALESKAKSHISLLESPVCVRHDAAMGRHEAHFTLGFTGAVRLRGRSGETKSEEDRERRLLGLLVSTC